MKKILAITLTVCSLFLFSCSRTVKMKFNDDGVLKGGDCAYRFAPIGYEPTNQGDEYALIKGDKLDEKLYKIGNCDPKKWLTTEYIGDGTQVYYSTDITLPTLSQMNPEKCMICEQSEKVVAIYTLGGDEKTAVQEREIINSLVKALEKNDPDQIWPRNDVFLHFNLKFYSPDWEAIYYNVTFADCGNEKIIHDRVTGNTAVIGNILDPYYESTKTNGNES